MKKKPFVSIITVSYNAVATIEQTILSVVNQKYSRFEYIIIDGGSKDATTNVIKKYTEKITLWISEPDNGIYDAMNKGIDLATGDWILFMNSGDSFVNCEVLASFFDNREYQADVLYGDTILKLPYATFLVKPEALECINNQIPFCHQSVFCRSSILKENKFDLKYKLLADHNFFYKLYKCNYSFQYLDLPVSCYSPEGGASNQNIYLCFKEALMITGKNMGLIYYFRLFLCYIRSLSIYSIPTILLEKVRMKRYLKNSHFIRL